MFRVIWSEASNGTMAERKPERIKWRLWRHLRQHKLEALIRKDSFCLQESSEGYSCSLPITGSKQSSLSVQPGRGIWGGVHDNKCLIPGITGPYEIDSNRLTCFYGFVCKSAKNIQPLFVFLSVPIELDSLCDMVLLNVTAGNCSSHTLLFPE